MRTALLALVVVVVGCKAADDYVKKSKQSEAKIMLNTISKRAKTVFVMKAAYPIGKVGPTPSAPCCGQDKHKCQVDPAQWQTGIWKELEFQIDDPHLFRYSYESTDGKSFTATAIGDLDCDTSEVTYSAVGITETIGGDAVPKVTISDTPTGTE